MLDKIQGSGLSQFLKDRIGILYTRDLNTDAVIAFLISLCLCAVLFDTALHLVYRVIHVFLGRSIPLHLVSNAYSALQVKPQIDVLCSAHPVSVQAADRGHAEQHHHGCHKNQADYTSALLHDCTFLSFFCVPWLSLFACRLFL